MGFKVASFSGSAQKMAIRAMKELLNGLKATGRLDGFMDKIATLGERSELLGLPKYYDMEMKYGAR